MKVDCFADYLLLLCSPMVWLLLICLTTSLLVSIKLYEWQYQGLYIASACLLT